MLSKSYLKDLIQKKIVHKLLIVLISVFLGVSIIIIWFFNYDNRTLIFSNFNKGLDNIIHFAEKAYQLPLWNLDKSEIKELNKALLFHDNIIAVNVYTENKRFFAGLKKSDADFSHNNAEVFELIYPYVINENQKHILSKSFEVFMENNNIGFIEIFYSDADAYQQVNERNLKLILTYFILTLFVLIVIYYFISLKIISPITYLADISNQVAKENDFTIRVSSNFKDEIAVLYEGFNYMLQNILQRDLNRDQMEMELTVMKNYLNSIIQSMPTILISTDREGLITQWNLAAEKYTGLKADHVIDKNLSFVYNTFDPFIKEFETTREPRYFNRQHIKNNSVLNIYIYPIYIHDQLDMVILAENVSELEKKDDLLRQTQKMETVGTLAGGLAHDFNNILGGIIGTLSIIDYNLEKDKILSYEKMRDYLDIMEKSASRAAEMVQQLLTLSRKQDLTLSPVDLNLTIAHVVKICKNTFEKSVEFIIKYSEQDPMIMASASHIEQAFLNLSINAYHAMTIMRNEGELHGGVMTITITKVLADSFFVQDHPEAKEIEYWKVLIADTGVGIDKVVLSKIFEPFYSTKGKDAGTGLGLTMVYNIIQLHNGFIDIYSEPGIGTSISVFIPMLKTPHEFNFDSPNVKFFAGRGTILIADDEPTVLRIGKEMLELCGYHIITADDGERAVRIYQGKKDSIDLVLLDMIMPKKSGKEAFLEIKKIDPEALVVLTSGFKQDERVEKVLEVGVQAFIQKPYTLEKLSKVIHDVLQKKRKNEI